MSEPTAPYVRGSDTSRAAAESMEDELGRLEMLVFDLIRRSGETGRTRDELEVETGMSHQTITARARALIQKGRVRDSGLRRRTRSDRWAEVLILGQDVVVDGASPHASAPRPSSDEIKTAVQEIKSLVDLAKKGGYAPSDVLQKLGRWLLYLAHYEDAQPRRTHA